MLNVVLYEPEIPQNTGNIARLCAATGCHLHLVGPLGFSLQDRYLKRAGLDYWHLVKISYYDSFQDLKDKYADGRFFYITSKGKRYYTQVSFKPGDFLVFGRETQGLPDDIIKNNSQYCLRIPMIAGVRCLNLSNSVAIVVYEALRTFEFKDLI